MGWTRCGAIVHSRDGSASDAVSTVEHRVIEGAPVLLLATCRGDLAMPLLEGMKSAFGGLSRIDDKAASKIVAAAPVPIAAGAAAIVLAAGRVLAAASGSARLYRQRGHAIEALAAGAHPAALAEIYMVTSVELPPVGGDFFGTGPAALAGAASLQAALKPRADEPSHDAFRNDLLDDLLQGALDRGAPPSGSIAAAALAHGF